MHLKPPLPSASQRPLAMGELSEVPDFDLESDFLAVDAAELTPRAQQVCLGLEQQRREQRFLVRWKIIVVDERGTEQGNKTGFVHGRTHDLALHGACIMAERQLHVDTIYRLLIAIPPLHRGAPEQIIEIHAQPVHSVLDGKTHHFRVGMRFLNFKKNGLQVLTQRLVSQQAG